jgi:hypothetical protein
MTRSPRLPEAAQISDVASVSRRDAWAVGYLRAPGSGRFRPPREPLLMRWDGRRWTTVRSLPRPVRSGWNHVDVVSAREVYALGGGGGRLFFERWDGRPWRRLAPPPMATPYNAMEAVGSGEVWVSTAGGALLHYRCG